MTMPKPKLPVFTPSGTPKLRSVTDAKLPPIHFQSAQPLSQPSPCKTVSTVRCVVPDREGADMPTWPKYSGFSRSAHSRAGSRLLALI